MIIKSNSIILASDLSPAFQAVGDFSPYKRGLFPIAFVDNLAFDVQGNRIRSKQIGGQEFSVESLAFSPTVSLSFDYVSSLTFDNENLLGMFFKGWGDFQSIFKGSNGQSCNLYFILSDLFGLDLIYQIKNRGNLNGFEMISFGNCTLSNYNLAIAAASLPKTSIQMEAVNMEMQVISSNLVNVPAINLAVGDKNGAAQLSINNSEFITNLNALNTSATGQPILPTYKTTAFNIITENPEVPSIQISPWADAAISSIGFSIGIEREASYGFGSDFIYDKKIKFPIVGNLNVSATALALNSGVPILTGAMSNESSYSLELQFIDPNELKYIGQSIQTLSGYANLYYKGFLTNNKYLKINNAKLESHSHNIDYASNLTVEFGFSFTCNEQNGLLMKWGQRSEKEGAQLFTYEGLKLQSVDGSGIDLDNYLYFNDASTPIIPSICASPGLSNDGLLLLTRDNTADFINYCQSPPPPPPPPTPTPPPPPPPTPTPPPPVAYSHTGTDCSGSSVTIYTLTSAFNFNDVAYQDSGTSTYYNGYFIYNGVVYSYISGVATIISYAYSATLCNSNSITIYTSSSPFSSSNTAYFGCSLTTTFDGVVTINSNLYKYTGGVAEQYYAHNGADCNSSSVTIYTTSTSFSVGEVAYSDTCISTTYTGYFVFGGQTYYYNSGNGVLSSCPTPPPTATPPPPPPPTPTPPPSVGPFTFETSAANDGTEEESPSYFWTQIDWTNASNATGYVVYRSEEGGAGPYVEIFSGVGNAYQDYDILLGGNYYWYNVAAFSGISSYSGSSQMVYFG